MSSTRLCFSQRPDLCSSLPDQCKTSQKAQDYEVWKMIKALIYKFFLHVLEPVSHPWFKQVARMFGAVKGHAGDAM